MAIKSWVMGDRVYASDLNKNFALLDFADGNATFTYNTDGTIATVVDTDRSATYAFTWASGKLVSWTDGTNTWTLTYNTDGTVGAIVKT
jgi:hypothetical protein